MASGRNLIWLFLSIVFFGLHYNISAQSCLSVNIGVIIDQNANPCNGPITLDAKYPGFNHTWNTGATTQRIIVTQSDTFIVVVDNGAGCSGTDTITVTFLDSPTLSLGPDPSPQCGGCTYLTAGTDPGLSYLWSTGETNGNIRFCQTGTNLIWVKVTNSVGCSVSDTINVTINPGIDVNLGPDINTCEEEISLSTNLTGLNHQWSSGETSEAVEVNGSGTYYVDVNDGSGCIGSDTINVNFLPRPDVDLGADPPVKCGGCITLDAGNIPGINYQWSTGQTGNAITYCETGLNQIILTATNTSNCFDRDTINVNILPGYDPSLGDDKTVCEGEVEIAAPEFPGASYLWNTGETSRTIMVSAAGDYSVVIKNISGCSSADTLTDSIKVIYENPLLLNSSISDESTCREKIYSVQSVTGANSYLWNVPAGCTIVSGQGTNQIVVSVNGNTTGNITVKALNGIASCESDEGSIFVNLGEHPLNIPNAFTPNRDGQNDTWIIRNLEVYPDNELVVLNRWGNEVYRKKNYNGEWDGSNLNEGTYFFKLYVRFCDEEKTISDYVTIVR